MASDDVRDFMPTTLPERKKQGMSTLERVNRSIIGILLMPWFVLGIVKYWVWVWKHIPF